MIIVAFTRWKPHIRGLDGENPKNSLKSYSIRVSVEFKLANINRIKD
jgi:hypothetical protein